MRGERSSWLTSELKRASRSMRSCSWSTMALNERVNPSRSGSAASGSSRVSSSPPAMARAARDTTANGRSERVLAKRPSAIPKMVVMTPATNERQGEHAQRVVEVGQVEDVEVVGVHGGDRDADHDLGRALRRAVASAWPPCRSRHRPCAVGGGWRRRSPRAEEIVGLGAVEEHRVGVGPRVDVAEQPDVGRGARLQRAAHRAGVEEGLVLGRRLPARPAGSGAP